MGMPFDPYCKRNADEIPSVLFFAQQEELTPEQWVRGEEGTFNHITEHFACDDCYIKIGQPALPYPQGRWVAP